MARRCLFATFFEFFLLLFLLLLMCASRRPRHIRSERLPCAIRTVKVERHDGGGDDMQLPYSVRTHSSAWSIEVVPRSCARLGRPSGPSLGVVFSWRTDDGIATPVIGNGCTAPLSAKIILWALRGWYSCQVVPGPRQTCLSISCGHFSPPPLEISSNVQQVKVHMGMGKVGTALSSRKTSIVEIHIHHTWRTTHTVSAFNGMDATHIPLGTADLWRTRRQEIPKSIWLLKTLGRWPRLDATPVKYRASYVAYYVYETTAWKTLHRCQHAVHHDAACLAVGRLEVEEDRQHMVVVATGKLSEKATGVSILDTAALIAISTQIVFVPQHRSQP
ncbi:hypothetical protein BC629DRAFT_1436634 [Irpex lacteus]|nr:hypothetical protein BC629DRAFT_1436634 [Irpex lacteus]